MLLIAAVISSTLLEAKPCMVSVDAISQEWLEQVAVIAHQNLRKYGEPYSSNSFLVATGWTISALDVEKSGELNLAVLKQGSAVLRFEKIGSALSCGLTVEDPGGEAWWFSCRVTARGVVLEKLVEGTIPTVPLRVEGAENGR